MHSAYLIMAFGDIKKYFGFKVRVLVILINIFVRCKRQATEKSVILNWSLNFVTLE